MNERRIARLQEQIKQRLAEVIMRELADPKLGMVTITRVELDKEFTQCRAYWSVLGGEADQKRTAGVLRRARGLCQKAMGATLHTRTVPHLEFVFDTGISEAIRLNNLMADLRREREDREIQLDADHPEAGDTGPEADPPEDPTRA
ncbi:MAG: 30S ribosome-binding factor RbfA [bacterium]|nr:30S ribosome-binding factor RbfA [bacterium]